MAVPFVSFAGVPSLAALLGSLPAGARVSRLSPLGAFSAPVASAAQVAASLPGLLAGSRAQVSAVPCRCGRAACSCPALAVVLVSAGSGRGSGPACFWVWLPVAAPVVPAPVPVAAPVVPAPVAAAVAAAAALPSGARVAVVGSRGFPALGLVESFVASLPVGVVVASGGAPGVDRVAVSAAVARGLAVSVLPADWSLGPSAGPRRSAQLVSSVALVVVFLCCGSAGASAAVALARRAGVPCFVVPCGCPSAVVAPSLWG